MSQKIPGGVTYCRILNFLNIMLLYVMGAAILLGVSLPSVLAFRKGTTSISALLISVFFALLISLIAFFPAYLLRRLNRGLLNLNPKARFWQIVISCLSLLNFPVGTVLYGIALYFMLGSDEIKSAFAGESEPSAPSLPSGGSAGPVFEGSDLKEEKKSSSVGKKIFFVVLALFVIFVFVRFAKVFNKGWDQFTKDSKISETVTVPETKREEPPPSKVAPPQKSTAKPVQASPPKSSRKQVILVLKNGKKIQGVVVSQDAKGMTLKVPDLGAIKFSSAEIASVQDA